MTSAMPLLISRDPALCEQVGAIAAASKSPVRQVRQIDEVRRWWPTAPVVLIGGDSAAWVAGLALAERSGVHVVDSEVDNVLRWSVPLGAMGLVLPKQSGMLTSVLEAAGADSVGKGRWIRVIGGSGGVGASTLAAALAQRSRLHTVLVELEPHGGGIDLMFGAENAPGLRWGDLRSAAGHVGGLKGQLPNVSGVDLVSLGRGVAGTKGDEWSLPGPEAVGAVLSSLLRSHQRVVLDGGWGERGLIGEGKVILLVGAGVRAVVAARSLMMTRNLHDALLVVRTGPGWRLDPRQVSDAMGLACIGQIKHERRLPLSLEMGDPPGRARGAFARQVDAVLSAAWGDESLRERAA